MPGVVRSPGSDCAIKALSQEMIAREAMIQKLLRPPVTSQRPRYQQRVSLRSRLSPPHHAQYEKARVLRTPEGPRLASEVLDADTSRLRARPAHNRKALRSQVMYFVLQCTL